MFEQHAHAVPFPPQYQRDALTAGKHFRMFKPAYLKPTPLEALEGANLTT